MATQAIQATPSSTTKGRASLLSGNVIDRAIAVFAPQFALRRLRARAAADILLRHYEGASVGRRAQGWNRASGDANSLIGAAQSRLRTSARDLVRNNGYAESALTTICDHVVGWGIVAKPSKGISRKAAAAWKAWADSTDCDSDGRENFYGLQHLVMRTVVESGECLVRRRYRLPSDGLPIPMQLQILEPDYIDSTKIGAFEIKNGAGEVVGFTRIINGIEIDMLGRRVAYWLFRDHPGSDQNFGGATSYRVPAESIAHVYRRDRPGQLRGASWFAPVLLKFRDFDEFEDATLLKQKIAACLAVLTTDVDGTAAELGTIQDETASPQIDMIEPGTVLNVAPGRDVTVIQPPSVRDHPDYTAVTLRGIATGIGVSYEDLTGDYSKVNFSSARMARLRHWARVENWRWRTFIPQFCDVTWRWAMQAAQAGVTGVGEVMSASASWTPPPMPMIDPANEGLAYTRNVRAGIMSLSEALRERGYDPREVLEEIAADNELLDELELVLDSDARMTTQAGNPRATAATTPGQPAAADNADGTPSTPATETPTSKAKGKSKGATAN